MVRIVGVAAAMLLGVASVKAVGDMPVSLFLHPNVGWCQSDLDEPPCSFDCQASCVMDDADIAVMCYEACVRDFPEDTIENVEYYPNGCFCQTSCETVECYSNTATLDEDYVIPACVEYDGTEDDFSCITSSGTGCSSWDPFDDYDNEELCAIYETCATTCGENGDDFASYDDIQNYCGGGGMGGSSCECNENNCPIRRLTTTRSTTKTGLKRLQRSIARANRK